LGKRGGKLGEIGLKKKIERGHRFHKMGKKTKLEGQNLAKLDEFLVTKQIGGTGKKIRASKKKPPL